MDERGVVSSVGRYRAVAFRLYLKHNVYKIIITLLLFAIYLYNVGWNVSEYQRNRRLVKFTASNGRLAQFPSVMLCATPPLHPLRLVSLGLNISADTLEELQSRFNHLTGINRELNGDQLLDKAGWKIQDFVEELQIGDIILTPSNDGREIFSKLWHRSFSPVGPCLEISAPADAILYSSDFTIKLRKTPPSLKPCTWVVENSIRDFFNPEICSYIKHNCNKSCIWENFISNLDYFRFQFIPSVYSSYDYSKSAFNHKVYTGQVLKFSPYEISIDSFLSSGYPTDNCLNRPVLEEVTKKGNCFPLSNKDALKKPLESICITGEKVYLPYLSYFNLLSLNQTYFENACKPQESELRWKLDSHEDVEGKNSELKLHLSSAVTPLWEITASYPLHKLLENIGGNLGLFLGLSLLELVTSVFGILFSFKCVSKRVIPSNSLSTYCVVTILAVPFTIQCVIIFGNCLLGNQVTSVTMVYTKRAEDIRSNVSLSIIDAVSLHMASRPLGCQLLSLTTAQKCLHSCLLESTPYLPLSFKFLEDLSTCQHHHFGLPQMKYILPDSFMSLLITDSLTDACALKCNSFNSSVYLQNGLPILNKEHGLTLVHIACAFGGIVGLYFGFSLQFLPYTFQRSKVYRIIPQYLRKVSFYITRVITAFICIILCFSLFKNYFLYHPVYTDFSNFVLLKSEFPTITVCFWPPFNVEKLLRITGSRRIYEMFNELNCTEKQNAIFHFIKGLQTRKTFGQLSPDALWNTIAWTQELLHIYTNEKLRPLNGSIFNACYSIAGTSEAGSQLNFNSYNIYFRRNASLYEGDIAVLAFVHGVTDFSPMANDMTGVTKANSMKLKRVSRWSSVRGESVKPGNCVVHCLDDILVDQIQCVLPWVDWRSDLHSCNASQFARFLSSLWILKPNISSVYKELLSKEDVLKCRSACQPNSQSFYSIHIDSIGLKTGNGFGLHILPYTAEDEGFAYYDLRISTETRIYEIIEDVDGYPLPLLLSELGSIVGSTLGISLLSLLLKLAKKLTT